MPSFHSRCFFLQSGQDTTPAACKWKAGTKKHGPQVAFQDSFVDVRASGTINLDDFNIELYQTQELTADTDISAVFNIPLVSDILVYPVILRIVSNKDLPSLGRLKKALCDYLIQNADHTFFPEEEEDDKSDLPSLSDDEQADIVDDDDDPIIPSDESEEEDLDDIVDLEQEEDEEDEEEDIDDDE